MYPYGTAQHRTAVGGRYAQCPCGAKLALYPNDPLSDIRKKSCGACGKPISVSQPRHDVGAKCTACGKGPVSIIELGTKTERGCEHCGSRW